ncbi:hypothetical protein KAX03_03125 [Candidatus Bathyarchaeota archaeon]|nr:hypothetical protein [Candidatus Bathyarchaeota archaeon]
MGKLCKPILSIIKLSSKEPTNPIDISEDSMVSINIIKQLVSNLAGEGYLSILNHKVTTSPAQRVNLAVIALQKGADVEHVCKFLDWKEFEEVALIALEDNGFSTIKHFRFKPYNKRFEIDILGLKEPVILSVDCKHWKKSWQRAATIKMVKKQTERTRELAKTLNNLLGKIGIKHWQKARLLPVVVTLSDSPIRFYEKIPVVAIHRFQNFLTDLPSHIESLTSYTVDL